MSNKKLLMFAVAGLLAPLAAEGVAQAEVHGSSVSIAVPPPVKDTAPVTGNPPRLRRTDQEQAGLEMPAVAFFKDGIHGLYFGMATELNGVRAQNNIQLSLTPITLVQDTATGQVSAVADTVAAKFVTANNGNERRNANAPSALAVNGGTVICAEYNYQPNGGSDTIKYAECFNQAGVKVMAQTKIFAKNNDDASMQQDGMPTTQVSFDKATATTKLVSWRGANGDGRDDGWAQVWTVKCDSADAPTTCSFANVFDVSLCPREERSRGACTVDAADPSYAVCSWTEGDTQPQRNGVWLAAIKLDDPNLKGADQQAAIIWKKEIAGRIDNNAAAAGRRTYAQRAIQERIMTVDAATGALVPSNKIMFRYGDAAGNNNTNEGKGGTYYTQMMSVIQLSKAGPTFITKPVDMAQKLTGLGGTHLGAAAAVFGTTDAPQAGLVFLNGSHTGGGAAAQIRSVALDASNNFVDLGMQQTAPHDRHLYSNYLGNNPGNQGRNHSHMMTVKNPFPAAAGQDAYLLITASSGKTMASTCTGCTDTVSKPEIKLTGLLTVTGIAQYPK
ncbi:MAG TPA: hypothetical protein VGD37_01615, partial [Kofleriaceae bacterium]